MTSLFNGVSGLLLGVFGGRVTLLRTGQPPLARQWIFRDVQGEIAGEDGHAVLGMVPILRVPCGEAASIKDSDRIQPGNGKTYRILNRQPSGSPAHDALVLFELECVS